MAALDTVKNDLTWVQKHERLVIVALVLLAGSWGLQHFLDNQAAKAETRANVAEQALVLQNTTNAQNAATTASVLAQYQGMVTALTAQNASLAAAAASRQAIVTKNQTTDATLALPELANRLQSLGNVPIGQVSSDSNHVILTQPGAIAVTQTLETIPALTANLKDQTALAASLQAALTQGQTVITDQSKEITGLNLAAKDADVACKAEVKAVKAEENKAKRKWFFRGVLVGLFGG